MSQPILHIECFTVPQRGPVKAAYYFRIRGANSEIVAASESYRTAAKRNKTARLLKSAKFEIT